MLKSKQEVFEYLNSGIDKSGYLKKEIGFSKKFPELYQEFLKVNFPEELKELPFKQRLWHFLKDDYSIHTCKICGGKVSFSTNFSDLYGYKTYCLCCSLKDNDIRNKSKKTCLEKYGVEYYTQTNEFKNKSKQTCLEKYGVESYRQTDESKERIKNTNLEKYGVENPFQSEEIKEKIKETNLEKYGVEYYSQTDESKERIKNTNIKKYGVECLLQSEEIKEKIKETNLKKYGVENYTQTEEYKEKCKQTNIKRYGVENPFQSEEIKNKIKKINLEKYGVEYYTQTDEYKEKIKEINLEKYGVENYSQTKECKEKIYNTKKENNTFNSSKIEEQFKEYLIKNNINFDPQHNTEVYPFDCDFYLIDYDLYIEIQGTWLHGEHPFNPNNIEDIELLEEWKSKCKIIDGKKNQYFNAIDVWTKRDTKKRQTAKENNLNYLEIFSCDINECVNQLMKKIEKG